MGKFTIAAEPVDGWEPWKVDIPTPDDGFMTNQGIIIAVPGRSYSLQLVYRRTARPMPPEIAKMLPGWPADTWFAWDQAGDFWWYEVEPMIPAMSSRETWFARGATRRGSLPHTFKMPADWDWKIPMQLTAEPPPFEGREWWSARTWCEHDSPGDCIITSSPGGDPGVHVRENFILVREVTP